MNFKKMTSLNFFKTLKIKTMLNMKIATAFFRTAVVTLLLFSVTACSRDPRATRLPVGSTDLAPVQSQLDKLSPEERQLVLDYVKRSKGDVLLPKFADPDYPLTARTFGEAIKLQREFNVKFAAETEKIEAFRENREEALERLREVLQIELVRREILPANQVSGSVSTERVSGAKQAINDKPVLVTTYRLKNNGSESIIQASGSVTVRDIADPSSLMGIDHCYISHSEPIEAGRSAEVRCANTSRKAGTKDEEYVAMSDSLLTLYWEPKSITLTNGKIMTPVQ